MDMKANRIYIEKEQKRITNIVVKNFPQYYLTGGTALAFYYNHRFSEDLDFFSQQYKKEDHCKIMEIIKKETGHKYYFDSEVDKDGIMPMAVYFLNLNDSSQLKIDFMKDYQENVSPINEGKHSVEDIYCRKINIAVGTLEKFSVDGNIFSGGRQQAKDVFDIYYLSKNYKLLSDFFFEYFSYDKVKRIIGWYRSFNRNDLIMELLEVIPEIDTKMVINHLDEQILIKIPDKIR